MTFSGQRVENMRQLLLRMSNRHVRSIGRELRIRGRSSMSKSELIEEILREMMRRLN